MSIFSMFEDRAYYKRDEGGVVGGNEFREHRVFCGWPTLWKETARKEMEKQIERASPREERA